MYAIDPPLLKKPYTLWGSIAPGTKPPYRFSNWVQFVTRRGFNPFGSFGSPIGDFAVKPTKAATAVAPADSVALEEATSST
jgi:hypothetical protein